MTHMTEEGSKGPGRFPRYSPGDKMVYGVLGSLGGVVTFVGAIWVIVRAVIHQNDAVKANTVALEENTKALKDLDRKVDDHDIRLVRVETVLDVRKD